MPSRPSSFDFIAVGESLRDVFYFIHDATVECALYKDACQLCLKYADKIPVDRVIKVPAAGNSANAAVAVARLGLSSALVTWIGKDHAGRHVFEHLEEEKVDAQFITVDPTRPTSESTIIDFQGEKTQLVFFQPRTYTLPKLVEARCIYYSAMGKSFAPFDRLLLAHLTKHSETFFTFQPGTTHVRAGLTPFLRKLIARADLFILNKEEAAFLLKDGDDPLPRLREFHRLGATRVVITDGKNGSFGSDGKNFWFLPAFPIEPIEMTGAGDSFSAATTVGLLAGEPIEKAMRWGAANSWNVIQHVGPQGGLLHRRELLKILKKFAKIKTQKMSS